jgi:hypothetical protein
VKKKKKDKRTELIEAIEARQPDPRDIEAAVKSFFDDVVYAPPSSHQLGKETKETSPIQEPLTYQTAKEKLETPTAVTTALPTAVITEVISEVDSEVKELPENELVAEPLSIAEKKQHLRPGKEKEFVTLDSTHTKSEALVYSIMYRETISKGREEAYFSLRRLARMTGIGSDKTVFTALKGLREKRSIVLVEHSNNSPIGTLYKVLTPKDVMDERKRRKIEINQFTKKIKSTTVTTAVNSQVGSEVETTAVGTVKTTAVTEVKTTTVEPNTPYISKYNINNDDSIKNIESSLKSSNTGDDSDDEVFNHRVYTISLYEKYTGNQWRVGDDEFYESDNLKDILSEIVEAAIIASVLRSKTKINSFAYCEGAIQEFQENLPLGYLNYLRQKWKEVKGKG